ncbi:MAG: glycoside hydrolase family 2 protein [Anaerolineae bacterium]|jgi:beta-mannosidase
MPDQSLTANWSFRQVGTGEWLPATVPGGVHTDLLALGMIPDPFTGTHEQDVLWVAEQDWEYRCTFVPSAEMLVQDHLFLVADGLDTLAKVELNGQILGRTANMFRAYHWAVNDLLRAGENTLHITFSGPAAYAARQQARRPMKGVSEAIDGGPHLRKAPCHFGWDWGPKLPAIGIWQEIRLEGRCLAWLGDVHLRQFHTDDGVTVRADLQVVNERTAGLTARLTVTAPDGRQSFVAEVHFASAETSLEAEIEHPLLWWPNGYGPQPLYEVDVTLQAGDRLLDSRAYKLGLRTIQLEQVDDAFGRSFTFVVNGVPIFAKGANWIPADSFITRFDDQRLEHLIASAAAAHQNMLRVWGGGLYEEERFYDLCDAYGILVWQDLIFSCSIYPLDEPEFHENVRVEVEENAKRLRHRTSLALWCGNNEMEWGWQSWGWAKHPLEEQLPALLAQFPELQPLLDSIGPRDPLPDWEALKFAYDRFYHRTLPAWLAELDPDTPYWPSSPSSGTPFHDVNGQRQGDAHYWEVWHGRKPFTAYRDTYPRFMSEFGFQALPTLETVAFYAAPHDWNLTSYVMEYHQRGNHGNGLIVAQMTDTFRLPEDFAAWVYLSLVLQAEGIRYGIEHWRRNMHRVSGTLYWQLNDCWPVASWSSIDYFGRWKALHYAARRFYAPLLLSVEDRPPAFDIHLTNDLAEPWRGTVRWSLETLDGEVIDRANLEVEAAPLADTVVRSLDFGPDVTGRERVLICELWQGDERLALSVTPFVPFKHLALGDPELEATLHEEEGRCLIELTSRSLALFVELKLAGAPDLVFSDNYFHLPPGRAMSVTCALPPGWTAGQARQALGVYSLYDSFTPVSPPRRR